MANLDLLRYDEHAARLPRTHIPAGVLQRDKTDRVLLVIATALAAAPSGATVVCQRAKRVV